MTSSSDRALDAFIEAMLDDDAEQLYDRAPCGYLSTTPEGTIVKVNQTFLTLTQYQREDLVGRRRFADLLSPGGRIYHETHYAPMLRMQDAAREIALDIVRADGTRFPVLVNSVLERDDAGTPLVIRTAVFDATQRREYERELLRAKERAEASEARARDLARMLQQTLIPPTPPTIPHLDIAAVYRPAGDGAEVGGDFYDVFQIADGDWVVVIGDVRGKGVEAAAITAFVRHTLRAAAVMSADPAVALSRLNAALLHHSTDRFCTVAFLRLSQLDGGWRGSVCAAGHPLPLLRRDGVVSFLGSPGSLLGVFEEPVLVEEPVELQPRDVVVLYTDGIPDGRRDGEFYGDERLLTAVRDGADEAHALADEVAQDAISFQRGVTRDDIAVVVARVPA